MKSYETGPAESWLRAHPDMRRYTVDVVVGRIRVTLREGWRDDDPPAGVGYGASTGEALAAACNDAMVRQHAAAEETERLDAEFEGGRR